jgi:hypothetical protein
MTRFFRVAGRWSERAKKVAFLEKNTFWWWPSGRRAREEGPGDRGRPRRREPASWKLGCSAQPTRTREDSP